MSFKSGMGNNQHFLKDGLIVSFECTDMFDGFQEIISEHMKFLEAYTRGVDDMSEAVKAVLEEELSKARVEAYEAGFRDGVKSVTEVSLAIVEEEEEDFPAWFESVFFGSCGLGKSNFTPPTPIDNTAPKFEDNLCDDIQMQVGELRLPMMPTFKSEVVEEPKKERKHSHYFKDVSKFDEMDTYLLARVWGIKDENGALFHALKKMLDAGKRGGGKDKLKDISEARDSLNRYLEVEEIMKND